MAEGAGSEGRRGPPPLPADIASAGVVTAPAIGGDTAPHPTTLSGAFDAGPFVELAALLAREAESSSDEKRRADLLVRLAMLFWDVLDDPEAAQRYLVAAGAAHPSAMRLRLALALAQRDDAALSALYEEMREGRKNGDHSAARRALELEFAEIWLFRQTSPEKAVACCRAVLAERPDDKEARELLALALAARKEWDQLAKHLIDAPAEDAEALLDAARVVLDGAGDAKKAAKLAEQAFEKGATDLYAIEVMLELCALGVMEPQPLLEKKLVLLGEDPRAGAERAATLYRLAELHERKRPEDARAHYVKL